jgi:hypothetical protein
MLWKYSVLMYVNRKVRPVETIPSIGEGWLRRMMEGVSSTMKNCKNFCKCHNVPPIQQYYNKK